MKLLPDWLSRVVSSNSVEREVEEELRFHLDFLTEEYVARGISQVEAEGLAVRRFGNLRQIKAKCAQIANRNRSSLRVMKALLVVLLLSGFFIRFVAVELAVKHIGEILVAIAILTRILLFIRGFKPAKVSDARN